MRHSIGALTLGHSDLTPVAGELDQRHPAASYEGRLALNWFNYYLRGQGTQPAQNFSYFRDWAYTDGNAAAAYTSAPSYPVGAEQTWYLSGGDTSVGGTLVSDPGAITPGRSAYTSVAPVGPNYTETSYADQSQPVTDPPGSVLRFTSPALARPVDVVGSPRLTVRLDAPTSAGTQSLGTAGQLVLFAKLYDIGPDGTSVELPHRLISPARVAPVTTPVSIELPGIVHRFATGHRLAVVLAGGDMAYRASNITLQPVSLRTGTADQQLNLPVTG